MRFARFSSRSQARFAACVLAILCAGCRLSRGGPDGDDPSDELDDEQGSLRPTPGRPGAARASGRGAASLADFGVVEAPLPGAEGPLSLNAWKTRSLAPRSHRLSYKLDRGAAKAESETFKNFFAGVRSGRQSCSSLPECAYLPAMKGSARALEPLVQLLERRVHDAGLDAAETADLLATLVQTIPYEIPSEYEVDLRPPALVLSRHAGDCDSKSLLLVYLARRLGIDAQLMLSYGHKHAMAALAVPTRSTRITHAGKSYAVVECTAKVPIGYVDPAMMRPFDWKVAPLAWPLTGHADPPAPAPAPTPATRPRTPTSPK